MYILYSVECKQFSFNGVVLHFEVSFHSYLVPSLPLSSFRLVFSLPGMSCIQREKTGLKKNVKSN